MKKIRAAALMVIACAVMLVASACVTQNSLRVVKVVKSGFGYDTLVVASSSVAKSRLKESEPPTLGVYLPPSYATSSKSYPVVYLLPGYGDSADQLLGPITSDLNRLFTNNTVPEFIIVGVSGRNALDGSFYVNSPATGNWEDYVVKEVIGAIEKRYRALPKREARGIAGFSMGGFGAFNLGLKHPEVYAAAFALSPGLLTPNGLASAMPTWAGEPTFKQAYGATFAPNLSLPSPFAQIPTLDGSDADNEIVKKWEAGFGDIESKVAEYARLDQKLAMLRIQYGTYDGYGWIPKGCVYAHQVLSRFNLPHELVSFEGGHSFSSRIATEDMIPFFAKYLKTE